MTELKSEYAIFLGKEEEGVYTEFLAEEDFYLILEVKDTLSKDEVRQILGGIKNSLADERPDSLSSLKKIIEAGREKIKEVQSYSLACGFLLKDVFYLLTFGEGEVYLRRGGKFKKIIEGENSASGMAEEGDRYVFTSKKFSSLAEKQELEQGLQEGTAKEVVEKITPKLKEKEDVGAVALFVFFKKETTEEKLEQPEEERLIEEERPKTRPSFKDLLFDWRRKLASFPRRTSTGRRATLVVVVVIFLIFVWSVVFGYKRRARTELLRQVNSHRQEIDEKLNEAEEVSSLNLQRSLILLSEAKEKFNQLKEIVGQKDVAEVGQIEQKIASTEKKIVKKEEKKYQEFFDLNLIKKEAKGEEMYLENDTTTVLNSSDGEIYTISLSKKSTATTKDKKIKGASQVASYNGELFFFKGEEGIYKVESEGKVSLVVEKDDQWGKIVDFWVYNGNLYLLDSGADQIHKYLVAEGGYSGKTAYFKPDQSVDLSSANSMAIDSSIYIAGQGNVFKYTAGAKDVFKVTIPGGEEFYYDRVFTDKNNDKLYLLDKDKGKVFVLSKEGQYEKQIDSAIFQKAAGFVVLGSEKGIFVLIEDKIYKVDLE